MRQERFFAYYQTDWCGVRVDELKDIHSARLLDWVGVVSV